MIRLRLKKDMTSIPSLIQFVVVTFLPELTRINPTPGMTLMTVLTE